MNCFYTYSNKLTVYLAATSVNKYAAELKKEYTRLPVSRHRLVSRRGTSEVETHWCCTAPFVAIKKHKAVKEGTRYAFRYCNYNIPPCPMCLQGAEHHAG